MKTDEMFPIPEGIPYTAKAHMPRLRTVRKAIKRTAQETVSVLDSWGLRSYDDYHWMSLQFKNGSFDPFQEEEKAAKRLSYLRALEFGLKASRRRNGPRS